MTKQEGKSFFKTHVENKFNEKKSLVLEQINNDFYVSYISYGCIEGDDHPFYGWISSNPQKFGNYESALVIFKKRLQSLDPSMCFLEAK